MTGEFPRRVFDPPRHDIGKVMLLYLSSYKLDLLFDRLHRSAADGVALVHAGVQVDILI